MKLRIHKNSLRLRLGPSEVARLLACGRIEETIRFAPEEDAVLTYALELDSVGGRDVALRYRPQEIAVLLSLSRAREWADGDQVGVGGRISAGEHELALLIEKDFACIDRKAGQNEDTFPNPKAGATC